MLSAGRDAQVITESCVGRDYLGDSPSVGEQTRRLLLQKLIDVEQLAKPCLEWLDEDGKQRTLSHSQLVAGVASFAQLFDELRLPSGFIVAIISGHRPEYYEVVAAAFVKGLVPVGIPTEGDAIRWGWLLDRTQQLLESLEVDVVFADADNFCDAERYRQSADKNVEAISFDDLTFKVVDAMEALQRLPTVLGPERSDEPTMLLCTSGTTGTPKGVILSEPMAQSYFGLVVHPTTAFVTTPPNCASGLMSLIYLLRGRTGRIIDDLDQRLELYGSPDGAGKRFVSASPVFLQMLVARAESDQVWLEHFKKNTMLLSTGFSRMPRGLLAMAHRLFSPVPILFSYAATEVSRVSTLDVGLVLTSDEFNHFDKEELLLTCGRMVAPPGTIRIYNPENGNIYTDKDTYDLEEGHDKFAGIIQIKFYPAGVTPGYYKRPEDTAKLFMKGEQEGERWASSGDYGYFYKGGFLRNLGRLDVDVFRNHDFASAFEVEDALRMHPAVSDAAVCGVHRSEKCQDDIVAFVIRKNLSESVDESQLQDFVSKKMSVGRSHHLVPKVIQFAEKFPLNANGKLVKHELIKRYLHDVA